MSAASLSTGGGGNSDQQDSPSIGETVEIVRIAHAGDGITADGIFVPDTVPGDVVRISREGSRGRVIELLKPGPSRSAPLCRHFGRCGGCALQMMEETSYLGWKRDQVVTALHQRGFAGAPVESIRAVGPGTRRRANFKARATPQGVQLGFYARDSRDLIDIDECPVLAPRLAALVAPLKRQLSHVLMSGETAELFATAADNGIDLAIRLKRKRDADFLMALSTMASALKLVRLAWNDELVAMLEQPIHRIGRFTVQLPIWPFLQPTQEGERILQRLVCGAAGDAKLVADLFCGIGTFALALAETHVVYAADEISEQIDVLAQAAREGRAKLTTETRNLMKRPLSPAELARFGTVVLDPPRVGAKAQADALAASEVPRVLYVSCNPASFARDARILCDGGYRLERVVPLDQFLWSPHVELFAEFVR